MKKIMTRLLSLVLLGTFIPSFVLADNWDLDKGSITVNATVESQTVSQAGGSPTVDNNPVITSSSGKTNNTVTITAEKNATANVTLENVNIDTGTRGGAAITTSGEGNVNIELDGTNTVKSGDGHAGLEKNNDGKLTITDSNKDQGSLDATGGKYGAGIGGGEKGAGTDISISGGKVIATGGRQGAGIGGGFKGAGTDISISGGQVTATGGKYGAGIGGGYMGAGTDISISGGKVTATGGEEGAGIGGGDYGAGTGIIVSGGEVNANGGLAGAGIGGGSFGDGTGITVSGGEVNAQGGESGAGIGGGFDGDGTDITVSNDAQVKVQGGKEYRGVNYGTGAGIGDGGTLGQDGAELPQDPGKLNGGTIQYYAPGANMQTDAPTLIVSNPKGNTAETAVEARQEAYWVCGSDGQALTYQSQVKDGVLTITVQADTASLRGTTGSLGQLEAQGIAEIRFVTKGAQSAFTLADLLASGTGSFTLTHEAETVTFTLAGKDISGILK